MKISVTDYLAPIGASVLKFCVHLQVGKVYCVNENLDVNPLFVFFFQILNCSYCHSYKSIWTFFLSKISQQLLEVGF